MTDAPKNRTFAVITNRDIYEKLTRVEQKIGQQGAVIAWHTWAIGVLVVVVAALISRAF